MRNLIFSLSTIACVYLFFSCKTSQPFDSINQWKRSEVNPILQDPIPSENYEVASDPHVFFDENGKLRMIYTGDKDGNATIKLADGDSWESWKKASSLVYKTVPTELDLQKETPFYYKSPTGKHQIYYIGYKDENTYESQIFLAEADSIEGPYEQFPLPVIPRGKMAGKDDYLITSPSVVEHEGK